MTLQPANHGDQHRACINVAKWLLSNALDTRKRGAFLETTKTQYNNETDKGRGILHL